MWVNCFSNHNELTISPLGKTPFAPSVNAVWRCTDRHRDELEQLKDLVQELEGRLLKLESEKIMLELGMKRLSEQLCRCSGVSTHAPGEGSSGVSYEMSDSSEVAEDRTVESPIA